MPDKPDLSEFFQLARPKRPPCQIDVIRQQIKDADELAALDAALGTDKGIITAGAIQQWLKARGHSTSTVAISNHRRGTCRCGDDG